MTRMREEDWKNALLVFRACLPRRGRKAADNRRFLEALHFFTVENARGRALANEYGHWNTVWKRFGRLSKAGVFEAVFDNAGHGEPMSAPHPDVRGHGRARACIGSGCRRGQAGQALGCSRGGFTSKTHGKADGCGDLIAFDLTGAEASDCTHFETLLDIGPDISPRVAIR